MHIAIIQTALSYLDNSTYNRQEIGLAKALNNQGFKVSLIFSGREEKVETTNSYTIHYLKCKKINQSIGTYINLWKTLDIIQPDIIQIHEFGMFMSFYALLWAKRRKVKCVLIQGSYEITRKPILHNLEYFFNITLGRYILKNVNRIGCKTQYAISYINTYLKCQPEITRVGLDASRFTCITSDNMNFRNQLNISPEKKILLYVGVIERRRHIEILLKTMQYLPNDYVLVLVGEGSQKNSLMQESDLKYKLSSIYWIDKKNQEELPAIYKSADLFLLASDYEIYGMVILEAMYWNVPVLSTETGGALSIIKDNYNGFIINSLDPLQWANKIEMIFSNKDEYNLIKKSTNSYIINNLLWKHTSLDFIHLYKNNE